MCTVCKNYKGEEDFTRQKSKTINTGLCKSCKLSKDKKYYAENKERMNKRSRDDYRKNIDERRAYSRQYYIDNKNNPDFIRRSKEYSKKSYIKNFDNKQAYQKQRWESIRIQTMESVGDLKCAKCGFEDTRALQIDHINGEGRQHRKQFTSNKHYMKYIKDNPSGFQILCANCNFIKRDENNEFRKSEISKQKITSS